MAFSFPAILVGFIAIGVTLPVETFNIIMDPLNAKLAQQGSSLGAGKIGHIIAFAILILFLLSIRKRIGFDTTELYAVTIFWAAATEGMQLFVPGRTPQLRDFIFDLLGVAVGTLIFFTAFRQFSKLWWSSKPAISESLVDESPTDAKNIVQHH